MFVSKRQPSVIMKLFRQKNQLLVICPFVETKIKKPVHGLPSFSKAHLCHKGNRGQCTFSSCNEVSIDPSYPSFLLFFFADSSFAFPAPIAAIWQFQQLVPDATGFAIGLLDPSVASQFLRLSHDGRDHL